MDIDNHPIPQDVSHFQFKLIGDLTVKQFGYLIGAAVLTYVLYIVPLFWFIKFPVMFVTALSGIILCFIPIEGRPSDVMLRNFIRALFMPNEFIFDKQASHIFMEKVNITPSPLMQTQSIPTPIAVPPVAVQAPSVSAPVVPTPKPASPVTTQPQPQPAIKIDTPIASPEPIKKPDEAPPLPETAVVAETKPRVRILDQAASLIAGFPVLPDAGNILLGICRDSRGNAIPNVLIEVKNQEGNPVRAFKTNTLGQFASATPLQNGTYTIYLEDTVGTHTFDTVVIEAKGHVLLPIEIISIDQREELRKQLFG